MEFVAKLLNMHVAQYISIALPHIFNIKFSAEKIPNDLKVALVSRFFSNYRPISVLLCFSKLLEKLMCKRLIDYVIWIP